MDIHVNGLYLLVAALVWLFVYHVTYALAAIARDPSLVCWGVGPLGVSVIGLRKPTWGQVIVQLLCAGGVLAMVSYFTLFVAHPSPITGLRETSNSELATVGTLVSLASVAQLILNAREWRFPLWGEARVLAAVQRSLATGAILFFTPVGRTFLRDRFGATPNEFLQTIRS